MLSIAITTLRSRKAGAIGALAAVVLAVTLVVSCGILLESSLRAPIGVDRLGAADVVVQTGQSAHGGEVSLTLPEHARIAAGLAPRLERIPGVAAAVADRSFDVRITGDAGRRLADADLIAAVGHGWSSAALAPYRLSRGRPPRAAGDIVVSGELARDARIGLGDELDLATAAAPRRVRVAGITALPRPRRTTTAATVFFRDDVATELSGTGAGADLVALLLRPDANPAEVAAAVRRAAPHLDVLTGTRRGEAESPELALGRDDMVAGLSIFAVIAGFVAAFVVAGTFALSIQQRHRELALLRAIGATPRQVRRMIAGEALLIALVAAAIASPIGVVAAYVEQRAYARAGLLPADLHLVIGWLPLAAGLVASVITTQVAAVASARRASRIRPVDALREAGADRRLISWLRALAGISAAAGGIVVLLQSGGGADGSAPAAAMAWMVAVALLGPVLAWPFTAVIGAVLGRVGGGPGALAHANTRAALRRVASVATPIMLAVSLAGTIVYAKLIVQQQTTRQTEARTTAGTIVRTSGSDGLPPSTVAALARVPGVVVASGSFPTSLLITTDGADLRRVDARAIDGATLAGVADLGLASGSIAAVAGDGVAVSTELADRLHRHVGDRVELRLGDGTPVKPKIVATYGRPLGFGDVLTPRPMVLAHVNHPLDDLVLVGSRPGQDARVRRLLERDRTLDVLERSRYVAAVQAAGEKDALSVYVLLGLVVAFCALALANGISMSTSGRSRELALLRLIGAERRQVRAMIRRETLIMVAFGVTVGTLIAIPGLAAFSSGMDGGTVPDVSLRVYAGLVGFYALVAFAATAIPVRLASRVHPVHALAARE